MTNYSSLITKRKGTAAIPPFPVAPQDGDSEDEQPDLMMSDDDEADNEDTSTTPSVDKQIQDTSRLYTKGSENPDVSSLRDLIINDQPNPEDYKPGTGGKILNALVAGATGFLEGPEKGVAMGEHLNEKPLQDAQAAFQQEVKNQA